MLVMRYHVGNEPERSIPTEYAEWERFGAIRKYRQ